MRTFPDQVSSEPHHLPMSLKKKKKEETDSYYKNDDSEIMLVQTTQ